MFVWAGTSEPKLLTDALTLCLLVSSLIKLENSLDVDQAQCLVRQTVSHFDGIPERIFQKK